MDALLFEKHAQMEDAHWWFHGRRRILDAVLAVSLPPGPGTRILDVGCGTGGTTAALAASYNVTGVEPSEPAVLLARKRFPALSFVHGSAPEAVRAEAGKADAFVMTDVLEHIENDRDTVEQLVDAAKPGALFLTTVPANPSLWTEHDVSHGHFRRYTLESYSALWAGTGVDVLLMSYYNSRLYPLIFSLRRLHQLRQKPLPHNDTDLSLPPAAVNRALAAVFGGESERLLKELGTGRSAYSRGVSIIALFRKMVPAGAGR